MGYRPGEGQSWLRARGRDNRYDTFKWGSSFGAVLCSVSTFLRSVWCNYLIALSCRFAAWRLSMFPFRRHGSSPCSQTPRPAYSIGHFFTRHRLCATTLRPKREHLKNKLRLCVVFLGSLATRHKADSSAVQPSDSCPP